MIGGISEACKDKRKGFPQAKGCKPHVHGLRAATPIDRMKPAEVWYIDTACWDWPQTRWQRATKKTCPCLAGSFPLGKFLQTYFRQCAFEKDNPLLVDHRVDSNYSRRGIARNQTAWSLSCLPRSQHRPRRFRRESTASRVVFSPFWWIDLVSIVLNLKFGYLCRLLSFFFGDQNPIYLHSRVTTVTNLSVSVPRSLTCTWFDARVKLVANAVSAGGKGRASPR